MRKLILTNSFQILYSSIILFSYILLIGNQSIYATAVTSTSSFIQEQCTTTIYPALCVQSLSPYNHIIRNNSHRLVKVAISVSLSRAHHAHAHVTHLLKVTTGLKPREAAAAALEDCREEMDNTVDLLRDSLLEMRQARRRREGFRRRIENAETWISAGMSYYDSCMDGFVSSGVEDGEVKESVLDEMLEGLHCASNALALITQYAGR